MGVSEPVEIEHEPARISGSLAVVAALIAAISAGMASVLAIVFGLLGLVGVAAGIFAVESRGLVVAGSGIIFVGVLVSGLMGNATGMLLVGAIATIVALDLGQNAISIGRQMTTDAYTRQAELVHTVASVGVGVVIAGVAYGVFLVSAGGQPVSALVLLLLAATLLVWSVRT